MHDSERAVIVIRLPDGRTSLAWLNASALAQLCADMELSDAASAYVAPTPAEAMALLLDAHLADATLLLGQSMDMHV